MTASIVSKKPWEYTLYNSAGRHVLSVVCGGAAMYELNIPLTADEEAAVLGDRAALEALVATIRNDPHAWAARSVQA